VSMSFCGSKSVPSPGLRDVFELYYPVGVDPCFELSRVGVFAGDD